MSDGSILCGHRRASRHLPGAPRCCGVTGCHTCASSYFFSLCRPAYAQDRGVWCLSSVAQDLPRLCCAQEPCARQASRESMVSSLVMFIGSIALNASRCAITRGPLVQGTQNGYSVLAKTAAFASGTCSVAPSSSAGIPANQHGRAHLVRWTHTLQRTPQTLSLKYYHLYAS